MRTVLACASAADAAAAPQFVPQLVDLLAQRSGIDLELESRAVALLQRLWSDAPLPIRREALYLARSGRPTASLVELFLDVAAPELLRLLEAAALAPDEWAALVDRLPDTTLSELRGRFELPPPLRRALRDARQTGEPAESKTPRDPAVAVASAPQRLAELVGAWRWEADRAGSFVHVEGTAPVLPGESLARAGREVARAFELRVPFRALPARYFEPWQLNAVPLFERDGRFVGFRGTADPAPDAEPGLYGTGTSTDAFAQMAHEIRTPLNAIMGFAQMIAAETLGPAAAPYRERAAAIVDSATRLLGAVEDLADATRLELGRYSAAESAVDIGAMVADAAAQNRDLATRRGVELVLTDGITDLRCRGDEAALRRALDRLLGALLACAQGEPLILGRARGKAGHAALFITRPATLAGLPAAELLDPTQPHGRGDAALGLGFAVRLAERLIAASGGLLRIEPHRFMIRLPNPEPGIAIPVANA